MNLKEELKKYGYDVSGLENVLKEENSEPLTKHVKYLKCNFDEDLNIEYLDIKIESKIGCSKTDVVDFLIEIAEELGVEIESIKHKE